MNVDVEGRNVYVATGDALFDPSRPVVVLVHGAGMNSKVWWHQMGSLAQAGFSVLAVDLPGHGRSGGSALGDVPSMGRWLAGLLAEMDVESASVVGHSMGTLVALEASAAVPDRIARLALLGTADVMPVNPELLAIADAGDNRAFELVTTWSLGRPSHTGSDPGSGEALADAALAVFTEQPVAVLGSDLRALDAYVDAPTIAGTIRQPVLVVIGRDDRMTRPSSARRLAEELADVRIVEADTGHLMMMEDPEGVGRALIEFFGQ